MESENGHVTVCPDTTITFTCSDTGVLGMIWFALPFLNEDNSPSLGSGNTIGVPLVVDDVFTVTLVTRERIMDDFRSNYSSTLDVVVNDVIHNGTNVTCKSLNVASVLIFKQGIFWLLPYFKQLAAIFNFNVSHTGPPPPPDVKFTITGYAVENFTTCLTWQSHKSDMYYLINTTRFNWRYNQTSTEICLIAEYNSPLQVSVVTVNCAGKSQPVTFNIGIGVALTNFFPL